MTLPGYGVIWQTFGMGLAAIWAIFGKIGDGLWLVVCRVFHIPPDDGQDSQPTNL
jgi:hypothetical protein